MTIQKQTVLTERNVRAALAEAGGDAWLMSVARGDELVARRIVCDGYAPDGGPATRAPAPVAGVRLAVDDRLPKGVWEIAPALAPAATEEATVSVPRSELERVLDAVDAGVRHHAMRDESNAAIHMAATTRLSPLTAALAAARDTLRGLLAVR